MSTQDASRDLRGRHDRSVDSALVEAAQTGDEQATRVLVQRYHALVRSRARRYFLAGADREDVAQEGLVGLFKAIRDYDASREVSFHSFADLCVKRQIISAVKTATRMKHSPLNAYVSLTAPALDSERGERLLSDAMGDGQLSDPAEIVAGAWTVRFIQDGASESLSALEQDVWRMHLSGCTYQQVADEVGRDVKAVDNALQRVKRKMEARIRQSDA